MWRRAVGSFPLGLVAAALVAAQGCGARRSETRTSAARVAKTPAPAMPPGCADFLAQMGEKPEDARFVGCESTHVAQLRALVATYAVPGPRARVVEQELGTRFHMQPLQFHCCGWESGSAAFTHRRQSYIVEMGSGETLEKRWEAIPIFSVSVYQLLELP